MKWFFSEEAKRERADSSAAKRVYEWAKGHDYAPFHIKPHTPRHSPYIPLPLGNVIIDLQPQLKQTIHVAVGGTSGLGKSSLVLPLLDLPIGVLIIALDNTLPITRHIREIPDGVEWSNEPGGSTAWNMLPGPPALVSEGLIAGWPRSDADSGHYRRIVRMRLWDRLAQADADGEVRSLPMLIEALAQPSGSSDGQVNRACRDWATKLASMYRMLGDRVGGPGDLDLVEAMQNRQKVLMRLNRFLDPEDAPTLGGMLLVHARRVAQTAGIPFVIILEEAGQMGIHQEQIVPLAQAGRDRDVPMVIINQNMSHMPPEVSNNVSVWVSFAQENKRELDFAAHHLRLEKVQLYREAFPGQGEQKGRGWCYVRAPGVPTHLVHIAPYSPKPRRLKDSELTLEPFTRPYWPQQSIPAIDGWQPWTPALPQVIESSRVADTKPEWVGLDKDLLRWYDNMERTNHTTPLWSPERGIWWDSKGCLRWKGPYSKHRSEKGLIGRPRSNRGKASVTVYIETAKAAGRSVEPTWDHCCDDPICCDPDHGYACSIAENNRNRAIRSAMLERAWMDRYGQIPEWWVNRHKPS